jgi:hypothetical protein
MKKKSQGKKIFLEFSRIFMVQHRNLFQAATSPNLTSLKLEASLGTTTK